MADDDTAVLSTVRRLLNTASRLLRAARGGVLWRGAASMPAVPRPVPRAEADEAAGQGGTTGDVVIPSQAVEAEPDKGGWHRSSTTRVGRGTPLPTPAPLNESEAVVVDRGC